MSDAVVGDVKEEVQEVVETTAVTPVKPTPIASDTGGMLGNTLDERYRVCQMLAAGGNLPECWRKPEQVFTGIQLCCELGLQGSVISALNNISMIKGKMTLWGELPMALALKTGQVVIYEECYLDSNDDVLPDNCDADLIETAVCRMQRRGLATREFMFTRKESIGMGVKAIWTQYFKIMLRRKARALAVKTLFSEVYFGLEFGEYDHHTPQEARLENGDIPSTTINAINVLDEFTDKKDDM